MNYEVILVNSCKKNHIEIISKKLNTTIVNSKSQNLIENLKLGSNKCTGDYVWAIDLKDSLCDKIYEENISWQNSDIIVFGYKKNGVIPDYIKHAQTKDNLLISHYNNLIYKLKEYLGDFCSNNNLIKTDFFINDTLLKNMQLINSTNCKFYKKEIFKNIIYNSFDLEYIYLVECKYSKSMYLCVKDLLIYNVVNTSICKKSIKNKINKLKDDYTKLNTLFNDEENNIIDTDNIFSENIEKDLSQCSKQIKSYIKYLCKVFNQSLLLDAIYMYNNSNKSNTIYFNKLQKYCIKYCDHKFKLTIGIIYQNNNIDKLKKLLLKLKKYVKNKNEIVLVNNSINKDKDDYKSFHKINYNVSKVLINYENKYPGYARSQIIQSAIGDYVWFLDDDDDIPEKNIFYIPKFENKFICFSYNEISKNRITFLPNRTEYIKCGCKESTFDYFGVLSLWSKWIDLNVLKKVIKYLDTEKTYAYNEDTIIDLLSICFCETIHSVNSLIYIKYPGISDKKQISYIDFKKILIGYSAEKDIRNITIKKYFYHIYYKYLSYYTEDVANKIYLRNRYNAVFPEEKWKAKEYAEGLGIKCLD